MEKAEAVRAAAGRMWKGNQQGWLTRTGRAKEAADFLAAEQGGGQGTAAAAHEGGGACHGQKPQTLPHPEALRQRLRQVDGDRVQREVEVVEDGVGGGGGGYGEGLQRSAMQQGGGVGG